MPRRARSRWHPRPPAAGPAARPAAAGSSPVWVRAGMRSAPGCRCFAGGSGNGRRGSPTPPRAPPPAPGSSRDRQRRPPAHADPSSTPACLQRYPSSNQHTAVSGPPIHTARPRPADDRLAPRTVRHSHTPGMPTDIARPTGPLVLAGLAGLGHLVVGYFYLAGGLVVPGPVLIPLWLLWLVLAVVLVRLAVRRSWWTPAVPIAAAAVFVLVLVVGEQALDWQG